MSKIKTLNRHTLSQTPMFNFVTLQINISNTRKSVSPIFKPRSALEKRGADELFNRLQGVWKSGETLARVFDN